MADNVQSLHQSHYSISINLQVAMNPLVAKQEQKYTSEG